MRRGIANPSPYPPPREVPATELARIMIEYGVTEEQARVIDAFGA